jgi:hypothetical protein
LWMSDCAAEPHETTESEPKESHVRPLERVQEPTFWAVLVVIEICWLGAMVYLGVTVL